MNAQESTPNSDVVMKLGELAAYLRIHTSTIQRLAKRHKIPHFFIGRSLRFNRKQIDDWIAAKEGTDKPDVTRGRGAKLHRPEPPEFFAPPED